MIAVQELMFLKSLTIKRERSGGKYFVLCRGNGERLDGRGVGLCGLRH